MSCDKLVFDLSQEVEGSPNVFIRKDWINILDNQNQNYQNNQSIIDTSQLANSNKYMGYRESYLAVPMLLSVRSNYAAAGQTGDTTKLGDFSAGLKNWFGTIIHSMTLDYNGTTIIQQTPFCNMWNSFKLLTTLSWADVVTMGPTIGFYPDTPDSFSFNPSNVVAPANSGICYGIANNDVAVISTTTTSNLATNTYNRSSTFDTILGGNNGSYYRTKWIAYNDAALVGNGATYGRLLAGESTGGSVMSQIWKSNICRRTNATEIAATGPLLQISIMATIYLRHLHSFFNMVPLLKGVFMKLTMNLNNCRCTIAYTEATKSIQCTQSSSYIGGTQVILVPGVSATTNANGVVSATTTGGLKLPLSSNVNPGVSVDQILNYDLTVGARSYNNDIGTTNTEGNISKSVYLYVPAYTFNPTFEQAYLSNPIKQVKYTDIYQYQLIGSNAIAANSQFNNLITNGIANIKSVLIIPFYTCGTTYNAVLGAETNFIEYLSPFSTAGGGTCAPMATISNFNVQISGQNAIYNMQRYTFEEWNNQLYGQNAVNGGLTDGLTSGLIDFHGFQTSYPYYYVNVERMLPVEQSVPKSVQILGQNLGALPLNLIIFIEYGVQVSIDVLTGSRV
jgi:hypothetical protein